MDDCNIVVIYWMYIWREFRWACFVKVLVRLWRAHCDLSFLRKGCAGVNPCETAEEYESSRCYICQCVPWWRLNELLVCAWPLNVNCGPAVRVWQKLWPLKCSSTKIFYGIFKKQYFGISHNKLSVEPSYTTQGFNWLDKVHFALKKCPMFKINFLLNH